MLKVLVRTSVKVNTPTVNDGSTNIGEITTSSPDAYKYFNEGFEHNLRGDFSLSIPFMERAVAIDPEFASAYRLMAWGYRNMGYDSLYNKFIQKAFELSDRLPERERYQIQGDYYFKSEETYDKAIEAYNKLLELYPEDWPGNQISGVIFASLEEWDKAIERYEVNVRNKVETFFSYNGQANAYMAKGLYDEAKEVCEYFIRTISDHFEIHFILSANYLCQGRYDLALDEADKAFSLDPINHQNIWLKGFIYHCKGDLVRAEKEYHKPLETEEEIANVYAEEGLGILCLQQGKFEKSIEHIKQAIDWAENVGSAEYKSFFHSCLAYIYTKSGDYQRALEECDEALRAVEAGNLKYQRLALHYKGLAYVEMDSLNEAQKIADGLKGLIDRGLNKKAMRDYYHLIGQIQLKRDKISNAIGYFKEAISLLPYQSQFDFYIVFGHALFFDSLASAYYRADDLEKACEEYENVTSFTTGRLFFGDIYARSLYMLGKIYQEQGKKSKAIEHYEKFLDLWKYADPGIAEVEDARKRLAGLKSQ